MTVECTKENFIPYIQNYLLQSIDAINYLAKRKVISTQVKEFGIGFRVKAYLFIIVMFIQTDLFSPCVMSMGNL